MALNKTMNPVGPDGSADPRDLQDNARVLDKLLNGSEVEIEGRLDNTLKTIAGLQAIITSLDLGSFTFSDVTSGLAGTTNGQFFRVPGDSENQGGWDYYRNDSGSAVKVAIIGSSKNISLVQGGDLFNFVDLGGGLVASITVDGKVWLTGLDYSVQDAINDALSRVKSLDSIIGTFIGSDIAIIRDVNGLGIIRVDEYGEVWLPGMDMSIQQTIKSLNGSNGASQINVVSRGRANEAFYASLPMGFYADAYIWTVGGVTTQTAGPCYIPTASQIGKTLSVSPINVKGGLNISSSKGEIIGGISIGTGGASGSLYEGYTLSAGDDFDELDIVSPATPLGRWFTTRTYLNPPRGSDTLLGTMYDADPLFTGFNDSNRGVPVGFDNMKVENSIITLQARRASDAEAEHMQGTRTELAAMLSSVGAFSFYAGVKGTGDCIIEWYAMFTHKGQNPAGWHPALWTQSSLPSYTYNSDEMDIIEGTSQFAASNYNIWGSDGSRAGGGSLGRQKNIFDGQFHKITAVLNQTDVSIYIDDILTDVTTINANAVLEPGYLLMSSHVYNGTYDGESYSAEEWRQKWLGASINIDWCRIWRRKGLSHITPQTGLPALNIDFGQSGSITLPSMSELWGRADVKENIQVVMSEENEPGGSHTTPYNGLPPFMSFDTNTRVLKVNEGYKKSGRINIVVYGYLQDGSSCEPARTYINIGPNLTTAQLNIPTGSRIDLYPLWDCGVLTTDNRSCKKRIYLQSIPDGFIQDGSDLVNVSATTGTHDAVCICYNSVNQFSSKKITITV